MTTSPRVRRIKVTKLFGIFDHEIPLNMADRITILHGPNGYGKTMILRMAYELLRGGWSFFGSVPFESFSVELDNGRRLGVARRSVSGHGMPPKRLSDLAGIEFFQRGASDEGTDVFSWETLKERCRDETDDGGVSEESLTSLTVTQWFIEWLDDACGALDARLIQTQRLTREVISLKTKARQNRPTVAMLSRDIVRSIKSALTRYADHAQELDSSFLDRLFQKPSETLPSMAEIEERLRQLEEKRARLILLGVLDPERDHHRKTPRIEASKRDVLAVYLDDTESKLSVLEDLAQRIELLTEAINRRFKYKQLSISRERGFVFRSLVDGTDVPLDGLSSGEQHEMVLLYELLFHVDPGVLVLIDEPELSLHLAWQKQFLGDLSQMVKLGGYDVLVATHSPAIVNDQWELTVELKGPELPATAAE